MKKKAIQNKITIDDLAVMVAKGFEVAEQNLEQFKNITSSRFNDMEDHFDGVGNRLTNIEKLFTKNEDEHKVFRTKINVLEKRI